MARTNNFWMGYGFIKQTLEDYKAKAMILKIMIKLNSYWHIWENGRILLMLEKTALTEAEVGRKKLDICIQKMCRIIN